MATIRDVAKLAGVSTATISRVLNKNGYVSVETEQKVHRAIQQLQFEPNSIARSLSNKKTHTIGLILPNISNPFFPELARAVEDVASQRGYAVILCNSYDQFDKEKSYIEILKKKYIDGIIVASQTLVKDDINTMKKNNIPLVVMDRAPTNDDCSVVRAKNFEGAGLAIKHLLDKGCKKIAHIYGPQDLSTAKDRLLGYENAVRSLPWYSPSLMVPGNFQIDGGMNATKVIMERHLDVDGIFSGNDLMAIGALKALRELGIDVPKQVAVCGFDGIGLTEIIEPELTTVAQPIYEMGKLAATILIEKIEGTLKEHLTYDLDVSLIERSSTKRSDTV